LSENNEINNNKRQKKVVDKSVTDYTTGRLPQQLA